MNRKTVFDKIEHRLSNFAYRLEVRGRLNLLEMHNHSEDFFSHFLNLVLGLNLVNMNEEDPNSEAIDLIDRGNQLIIQVSAQNRASKIRSALTKQKLGEYSNYRLRFVIIDKDSSSLRSPKYENPYNVKFDPQKDIMDIVSLMSIIKGKKEEELEEIYELLRRELPPDPDLKSLDSDLATLIGVLSKEDFSQIEGSSTKPFEINDKIEYNGLARLRDVIRDHTTKAARLDRIYAILDEEGVNRSLAVFSKFRKTYLKLCTIVPPLSEEKVWWKILDTIKLEVLESTNVPEISDEMMDYYLEILASHAFINCRIFGNPNPEPHAVA